MILMESLNKAAYIYYETRCLPNIVDKNGRYTFSYENTEENNKYIKEYNEAVNGYKRICVNLSKYNKCIFELKTLVKTYKKKKAEDIIFGDRELKFQWKKKEDYLNKVDEICDKVIENIGD